jgi:hypothetical protein
MLYILPRPGIPQYSECSVGWTTEGSQFGSQYVQRFCFSGKAADT